MPHILFLTEKWCDAIKEHGPTNSEHNLFGSLHASRLATFEGIHFDELARHGIEADKLILARLRDGLPRPDLVVATPIWNALNAPSYETYVRIREMGIPIVFIFFDASAPDVRRWMQELVPLSAATVVLDLTVDELFDDPRFVPLWTPQDPRIFHNPNLRRTIDVSFAGSMGPYPDRQRALARLRQAGIDVLQAGGQREGKLNVRDYAAVYQQSRISLNFAKSTAEGRYQVKGRVLEATLCGSLLLEEDNVQVRKWLEPGKDYVPFTDLEDLVAKVEYYLCHEGERALIARNGQRKVARLYHARQFWGRILDLAGIRPPGRSLSQLWGKLTAQPLHRLPARVWQKVCRSHPALPT